MSSFISIKIPKKLYDRLDAIAESNSNGDVEELIFNTLRERIAKFDAEQDGHELTEDEEERIKERLRELGYL